MDVVAVARRRVKEGGAVRSHCGCVSSVTMALTLFAKNVSFKVVWWTFGGLTQLTLPLFFYSICDCALCEINILRPLFQFWLLHSAFPTGLHAPDNCSTVCRETSTK